MPKILNRGRILVVSSVLATTLFSGCGNSENFVFTNTVDNNTAPIALPQAQDDTFAALGNATLNQAASGVLANDTLNGAEITDFDSTGSQGGTIALNKDGSFSYTPVIGFKGTETFNYTVSNLAGSSTATVTLTSTGFGRFVDNTAPSGGDGSQASPFDTLIEAANVAQAGDIIYVARGNGTNTGMTGGFTLPQGVNLIGEGTGLILGQTIEPAGQAPTIEGPIVCKGDNVVQGLTIDGSVGAFSNLIVIEDASNVTITQNTLADAVAQFIDVRRVGGNLTITDNVFERPNQSDYICIDNDSNISPTVLIADNTFKNDEQANVEALCAVDTSGGGNFNLTFSRNTADGTQEDEFDLGLVWDNSEELTSATLTCEDNLFNNFDGVVIDLQGVSGTISDNILSNLEEEGIVADLEDQTLTLSGNAISNGEDCGIALSFDDIGGAAATVVLVNNNVSVEEDALFIDSLDVNNARVALRSNMFTTSGVGSDRALDVEWDEASTICFEVVGNTFNGAILFDAAAGLINIERREQFESINTVSESPTFMGNTASIGQGECQIP